VALDDARNAHWAGRCVRVAAPLPHPVYLRRGRPQTEGRRAHVEDQPDGAEVDRALVDDVAEEGHRGARHARCGGDQQTRQGDAGTRRACPAHMACITCPCIKGRRNGQGGASPCYHPSLVHMPVREHPDNAPRRPPLPPTPSAADPLCRRPPLPVCPWQLPKIMEIDQRVRSSTSSRQPSRQLSSSLLNMSTTEPQRAKVGADEPTMDAVVLVGSPMTADLVTSFEAQPVGSETQSGPHEELLVKASELTQMLNQLPPPVQPLPPPGKFADGKIFTDESPVADEPQTAKPALGELKRKPSSFGKSSDSVLPLADFMHVREQTILRAKGCALTARFTPCPKVELC
jgi:hypothetical protein